MQLNWQAEEVIRAVRGQCLHEQNWLAHGIAIDSRAVRPGDLFIALKGPTNDAHEYVAQAFANGAVAAIVQRAPSQVAKDAPLIHVEDTFVALEELGRAGRARATGKIIALTGSVGKTSSKEQLRLMLSAVAPTYANEGSLNNHWGVPLSLARLPADAAYGVFELGMNHAGEMTLLSKQVRPHVCLITNIEAVHLEHFASLEEIADAKAEIFLGLEHGATAVLNRDNAQFARLQSAARAQGLKNIFGFGRDSKSEARLIDLQLEEEGSIVTADILGQTIKYKIATPGAHIAMNSLGTLLTAAAAGADVIACADALAVYRQPKGRGTIQSIALDGGNLTLIDESYNASPVAVRAAIEVLARIVLPAENRHIVALGDMRELGSAAPQLHADLAKILLAAEVDCVHCCGEMMRHLYDALPAERRGHYAMTSAELAPLVAASVRGGDAIMIKGSHSMQMERVVESIRALETKNTDSATDTHSKMAC